MASRQADPQQVPKILRVWLYAYLLIAGVAGAVAIGGYSPLPTTAILDAWVITFILACIVRGATHTTGMILLLGLYLLTRVAPALLTSSPIEDFLQAHRWLLYLIAFAFAVGRRWGPGASLRVVTLLLIGLALVKAALTFAVAGGGERPGLLLENNFEIALFTGLLVAQYRDMTNAQRLTGLTMLAALMPLAGSRSGAVAFAVLVVYAISQLRTTVATRVFIGAYALPMAAAVPALVFAARSEPAVVEIDRLQFLDVFLKDASYWWTPLNWLFGTMPITPLQPDSCLSLAYYQDLFSSVGDGTCYAVILHAFVLRVLFDAGILGLVIAFLVPWLTMRRGGVSVPTALALLAIAGANSLSVSGLNNPYVALPILLAVVVAGNRDAAPYEAPEPEVKRPAVPTSARQRWPSYP